MTRDGPKKAYLVVQGEEYLALGDIATKIPTKAIVFQEQRKAQIEADRLTASATQSRWLVTTTYGGCGIIIDAI